MEDVRRLDRKQTQLYQKSPRGSASCSRVRQLCRETGQSRGSRTGHQPAEELRELGSDLNLKGGQTSKKREGLQESGLIKHKTKLTGSPKILFPSPNELWIILPTRYPTLWHGCPCPIEDVWGMYHKQAEKELKVCGSAP